MAGPSGVTMLKIPLVGANVWVDVLIGQAQHGEYRVRLYDASGKNPQDVGEGNNFDTLPDSFRLNTAALGLENRLIGWRITIASPQAPDGQLYYARIIVREENVSLSAEPIEYSGPLDGAKIFLGYAKFCVA